MSLELNSVEKNNLLKLSRMVLETYLRDGRRLNQHEIDFEITDNMKKKGGGFVTLTKNGELRGCIGEIMPVRDILSVIMDRTVDSAINDYRFSPVVASELDSISIEISILTLPETVSSYQDIEIGRHGIVFYLGESSSVFLPQVAGEQGWNLETTLSHLSLKAGTGPDGWRSSGAIFEVFEAHVFNQRDLK